MLRLANVTFDCADPPRLAEFWSRALGYTVKDANEFFAALAPPSEGGPTMLFLKVPEPRTVKNRVHLDLMAEDREAEVQRLLGLGATRGETRTEFGINWTTVHDPEGNELCIAQQHD